MSGYHLKVYCIFVSNANSVDTDDAAFHLLQKYSFRVFPEYIEDIQMFLLNMSFISRVKWTIFIFHEWRSHECSV